MASFARMRRTLKRIRSFPLASRDSIKRNIRRGLLCACNMENVPYYGSDIPDGSSGECHGFTVKDGIRHGYDDCCKL